MPPPSAPPSGPTAEAPEDPTYLATAAAAAALLNFNAPSFFGGGALTTGFTPDPWPYQLTAGSGVDAIDVTTLNLRDDATRQPCSRSYVTRRPDFHFEFQAGSTFQLVRFYVVTANGADATLLINQPNGRWRCNDDHGRPDWTNPLMPAIDFRSPPTGRYDIWVGSFDASSRNPATLYVTELDSNHP